MGFSRKELYYFLETASDRQLSELLGTTKEMLSLSIDEEQIKSMKFLRKKIIEEITARKESKLS